MYSVIRILLAFILLTEYHNDMKYLSTGEIAKKWGISQRRVALLCSQGRINGALKAGNTWIIPEYALKPTDERFSKELEVSEQSHAYGTDLRLNPTLLRQAALYYSAKGESISDAINQFLYDSITKNKKRIGVAKDLFQAPKNLDFCNAEVADLFGV